MALVVKDRVKEITTTTGTSNLTLGGAVYGFQSFSVIGNGNTTYYGIYDSATGDWEVGVGTYSTTGPTLSRDTVLESSNSGSKVVFAAGSKDVFVTYPAERSVYLNAAGLAVDVLDIGTLGTGTANITSANITAGTISTTPTSSNDLVNKTYVDGIAAQGISYHTPVKYEVPNTTGNLNAIYNQPGGPGVGVGATLTNNGTLAAFAPDGPTASVGDRILVYNQTNAYENGVYTVTTVGSGSIAWVLTRSSDTNTYGVKDPNQLGAGDAFYVTSGNTGAGETYVCNTAGTITFGTTAITFAQISSAQVYSAGTGLTLSNLVFSITPVGTASTYGSASQVPVFTTNASGQVTSVTNTGIAISAGAVSGLAPSATTDTTNAANITSGTLPVARLSGSYTGITGVGTLTAGTWNASTIGATYGGTGITSYTIGDILYADTGTTLARLADVATGNALISGGVGTAPSWGKIGLQTHVSGTLQVANGGTGATTLTGYVYGNGTGAFTASTTIPNSATTATSANTASAIVARDASGNFSAGTITASLSGNASTATSATSATTATNLAGGVAGAIPYQSAGGTTAFSAAGTSGQYLQSNGTSAPSWSTLPAVNDGTLTMNVSGTGLSGSASFTANQSGNSTFTVTSNATSANTASTIVARDASGNFNAGTITATLSGNASTATTATTATTANALNTGNSYTVAGLTVSAANAYIVANRTNSGSGQVGYNWAQGGSNLWWNYVDTGATTLSWYNSVVSTNVMTLTTGGALNTLGAITQNGSQVLTAGNYNSYAPTLTGGGASGTWGISISGNAATASNASLLNSLSSTQLFNNMGQNHTTYTDANSFTNFGTQYLQGTANGPGAGGSQWYMFGLGLGNDYPYSSYAMQFAIPRTPSGGNPYISIRFREGGSWGSWAKIWAGYADSAGSAGSVDYANLTNKTGGTGTYTTSGDYRAPIFYDSNDTGYYIDPNSTSDSALRMRGGALFGPNTTWGAYLYVGTNGRVGTSATVAVTNGNLHIDAQDGYNLYLAWYNSSDIIVGGGIQATIYYDRNNTGYYLDPASTSELNKVYYNSNMVSRNYGIGQVGLYSSYRYQAVFSMGESYLLPADGTTTGNLYGMAWSHPNAGGVAGNLNSHGLLLLQNGSFMAALSTNGTFSADIRGTIFYDYNNTGYYCDPASTSVFSGAYAYGSWYFQSNQNTGSGSSPPLQAYSTGSAGAIMSFHRGGYYAVNMGLDSDNVFRIGGWSAPANLLQMDMSGNLTMAANVTAYSDERLKKDWDELPDDFVQRLAEVKNGTYTRTDSNMRQVGVGAQSLQELLPEAVLDGEYLSVAYGNAALAACVELAKSVVALRAELNALRAQ